MKLLLNQCCALVLLLSCVAGQVLKPTVAVEFGTIRGYYDTTADGKTFAAFEGVPYARPPVGKYRFREPKPLKPWRGVWEANQLYKCMQYDHYQPTGDGYSVVGDEDCLYLNVYTPQLSQAALLDVVVFIHGGAFMFGAGHVYGHRILMERQNVVYVSLNYRLGPLGFLSTEDAIVPGNNGLKDQSMALKWIKNNVQYFGGNPNSITLTGLSAGAASVEYHYLSPSSSNLFHRGIAMSGSVTMPWARTERSLDKAKRLAQLVGCDAFSVRDMVDCMRYRPARHIVGSVKHFTKWLYNPFTPFGPVVETPGLDSFLTQDPYVLLHQGSFPNIPIVFSVVQAEGLYPAAEFIAVPERLQELESRWIELAPAILDYNHTAARADHATIALKCKEQYLKQQPISPQTFNDLVQMVGDRLFVADIEKAVILHARRSPVYFSYFTYRGKHSKSKMLSRKTDNVGVCHTDDTIYILSNEWCTPEDSVDDRLMKNVMLDIWTTYAKTGVPRTGDVTWSPVAANANDINYLHIASPQSIAMKTTNTLGRRAFWNSLPINENRVTMTVRDDL